MFNVIGPVMAGNGPPIVAVAAVDIDFPTSTCPISGPALFRSSPPQAYSAFADDRWIPTMVWSHAGCAVVGHGRVLRACLLGG